MVKKQQRGAIPLSLKLILRQDSQVVHQLKY